VITFPARVAAATAVLHRIWYSESPTLDAKVRLALKAAGVEDLLDEVTRLSAENAALRAQVEQGGPVG